MRSRLAGALLLVLAPSVARAQLDVPPEPVLPAPPPPAPPRHWYESLILGHRPSPQWTQDRSFTSTRFWLLDPGTYEAQVWLRTRVWDDPKANPAELLLQAEIEVGLVPHLQLDIYENLISDPGPGAPRTLRQEGNQIELRIAIPSYYGQIFGNPVIYLEWHPRRADPDRFEARLLLGGAPTRWLYLAMNPYVELNVEPTDVTSAAVNGLGQPVVVTRSTMLYDMEVGATLAAGFRVAEWLRLSVEAKVGGDMLGSADNALHFVAFAGPGFIVKPIPKSQRLKIM